MTDKTDTNKLADNLRNVARSARPAGRSLSTPRRAFFLDDEPDYITDGYDQAEAWGCGKYGFDE